MQSSKNIHQMRDHHSRWCGYTERNQSNDANSEDRPGIHQLRLQKPDRFTDIRIVIRIVTLLPIHPVGRRLVVPLYHLHFVDPFPKNNQILVHVIMTEVLIVSVSSRGRTYWKSCAPIGSDFSSRWKLWEGERCRRKRSWCHYVK